MRFFVLTKKKLLAFGCCVLVGALAVMIGFQGAGAILQTVASPRRFIPYKERIRWFPLPSIPLGETGRQRIS